MYKYIYICILQTFTLIKSEWATYLELNRVTFNGWHSDEKYPENGSRFEDRGSKTDK